jgi:hypothetical protein
MRLPSLAILCLSVVFAASPAFAQMTQQNRPNQGQDANPPRAATTNQGNATTANQGDNQTSAGNSSGRSNAQGAQQKTATQ